MPGHQILEHPADLGIEAWGASFSEALSEAVAGLGGVLVDPSGIVPREERDMKLAADDRETLVVRVLSEVLYRFDADHFVPSGLKTDLEAATAFQGAVVGESLDPSRHQLRLDVKAVTYHQLSVVTSPSECRIRVFLDI